jgi:hypothetical protein
MEAYKYKAQISEERATRLERSLAKMLEVVKEYRGLNPKGSLNGKDSIANRQLPAPSISYKNRFDAGM